MARLIVVMGEEQRVFEIELGSITIGRADDNTAVLNDPSVSRHHAEIVRVEDGYL